MRRDAEAARAIASAIAAGRAARCRLASWARAQPSPRPSAASAQQTEPGGSRRALCRTTCRRGACSQRRHRREGGDDRPRLRLGHHLDGVARQEPRADAAPSGALRARARRIAHEARSLAEAHATARQQRRPWPRAARGGRAASCSLSADVPTGRHQGARRLAARARSRPRAGRAHQPRHRLLATIGATAPFVGLFGTVWGIMNSFIGISKAQTTNLAVVAPGIAEALLATAHRPVSPPSRPSSSTTSSPARSAATARCSATPRRRSMRLV